MLTNPSQDDDHGEFRSLARKIARGSHANRDVDAGHTGEHVFVRLGKFLVYDLDKLSCSQNAFQWW